MESNKGIEVRELAEQFFEEEINKLDDPQRKEEVELEKETYIGVWMLGYRACEAQPGAVWVKARGGMPEGIYSMKLISNDVEMRGTGLVNHGVIQLITFLNKSTMGIDDLPKDYEGVYYLDELGTAPLTQSRADLIREANNRDLDGVGEQKENSQDDIINFSEWAATIAFFDDGTRLWELIGEGEAINGQFRFTTKEFYVIFKQQKEK